ncbi:MAG: DUF4399 domain-containing protein [Myxococcota bacterium]
MNPTRIERPERPSGATRAAKRPTPGLLALAFGLALACATAHAADPANEIPREKAPEGAAVYFIAPSDGEILSSPVTVRFGLKGMGVAPAGVAYASTGHHHLILDTELPPLGLPVPSDENHIHFGKGQTEVDLELPPGEHTLQLLLGDKNHVPHDPPVVSERITIRVK